MPNDCPPPPPPPPPPEQRECDWGEIYQREFAAAQAEAFSNIESVLGNLIANIIGGFLGKPFKFVGDDILESFFNRSGSVVGDLADGVGGGAVSGALTESGERTPDGDRDGVSAAEIAGIVGGVIAGVGVGWLAGLTLAGILAAAVAATIAGIAAEAAVNAGIEANRLYNECLAEGREETPDPVPGPGGPLKCPPVSPLIIDMDGDGVETLSIGAAGVFFDLDADGRAERTGWVAPDDALLVLDRNADGRIGDITELFGSATEDGFSELARLDSDGNRQIDAADERFEDLRLWQDRNSDGVAQEAELVSLHQAGIAAIDLDAATVDYRVAAGAVTHAGTVTLADGTTREVLDVWFDNDTSWTRDTTGPDISVAASRLPGLAGSGRVADLHEAMTADTALLESVRDLIVTLPGLSAAQYRAAVEQLVADWAGVADVPASGRGNWINARHLAVMEAFHDFGYRQISGVNAGTINPGPNAAYEIEQQYDALIDRFVTEFAAQASLSSLLLVSDLHLAGDPRAAALVSAIQDGSALILGSLSYDEDTARVALSSVARAIDTMIATLPDTGRIAYLDRYIGRLAGVRAEHFGPDEARWEAWLSDRFAAIADGALREIALDLARGHSVLAGGAQDDVLTAADTAPDSLVRQPKAQQSVLAGGAGNDLLDGRAGGDTYVFQIGDGADTISDSFFVGIGGVAGGSTTGTFGNVLNPRQPNVYLSTLDKVVFPGRTLSDAIFAQDGDDLLITFRDGSGDSLRITGQFALTDQDRVAGGALYSPDFYAAIERFVFADSGQSAADLAATDGDDVLFGTTSDDVLRGGLGNDTLNGSRGNDVFSYSLGDGNDVIASGAVPESGDWVRGTFVADRILLTDLTLADVQFLRSGADATLLFSDGGSIQIAGQGRSAQLGVYNLAAVEGVQFADGTVLRMDVVEYARAGIPSLAEYPNIYTAANAGPDGVVRSTGSFTANDIFVSGAVSAVFDGRAGHDTYVLTLGDAPVRIVDRVASLGDISAYANDQDVLLLRGMSVDDLSFQRVADDDMLVFHNGSEIARVSAQYLDNNTFVIQRRNGVETIIDQDGKVLHREDWEKRTVTVGSDGGDFLRGIDYFRNDDSLYYNADIYRGGLGDDTISDENGSETYLYAEGDGNDVINDRFGDFRYDPGNDEDRLILTDLNAADVRFVRIEGPDFESELQSGFEGFYSALRVEVLSDGGSVQVNGQFSGDLGGLEFVEFADGTVWDKATIAAQSFIYGTAGDDLIDAFALFDGATILADAGNDLVSAFGQGVRAIYAAGDGNDEFAGIEILQFTDINSDGVRLLREDDGRLRVVVAATGESILFAGADGFGPDGPPVAPFSAADPAAEGDADPDFPPPDDPAWPGYGLAEIRFASGEIWDAAAIAARIELPTTDSADTVDGGAGDDRIFGGAGDDSLSGGAGNDTLSGGDGADTLSGGDGDDVLLLGADGDAVLDGGAGRDRISGEGVSLPLVIDLAAGTANGAPILGFEDAGGGSGADSLAGDGGDNRLAGGSGDDTLNGRAGDDTLEGGRGADLLAGGEGTDGADYSGSLAGIRVALDGTAGQGGHAEGDQLSGIENLTGSNYSDSLTGDGSDNRILGLNGTDTLAGLDGADTLDGGAGDDGIFGGQGHDVLAGGIGRDALAGGAGDDTLEGGAGRDTLGGGAGGDTYVWNAGDGDDVILDLDADPEIDVLALRGIDQSDLRLVRVGSQLNLLIAGRETISIVNQFDTGGIEEIRFDDGSSLLRDTFVAMALAVPNQAPIALDDSGIRIGGQATVIAASALLRNDADFERDTLTIVAVFDAVGGSAVLDADGNVVFTPDGTGTAGAFSYTLSDGSQTDDARVSLVIPGNIAPVLATALPAQSGAEDQPLDFTLPAGAFTDADGDALTLSARLADGQALPGWLAFS